MSLSVKVRTTVYKENKMKGFGYLLKEGIKNLWHNRMMTIASVGILMSCLLLTGMAILICINVGNVVASVGNSNVTNVYLADGTDDKRIAEIGEEISKISNISNCSFYSKEEAIKEYKNMLGDVFDEMQGEGNPLPDTYHVTMNDLSMYDTTISQIKNIKGVDEISSRSDVAQKLTSLANLVATMGFWIVLILAIISLFIISNTIKMTMYSRRFAISIMKSVGATNMFVRVPFIVEGMAIGAISGGLSVIILYLLYGIIMNAATTIVPFTSIDFSHFAVPLSIGCILSGITIGAMGAIISISKYLKKEGNELLGW